MEVSKLLVVWAMLSLALGCDHLEDNPDLDPVDGGEDPGDTDSDTDSDVDGDTDSDTDTETGEETDVDECPWNSGWPCACDSPLETCEDGSVCLVLDEGDAEGVCSSSSAGGGCPAVDYDAEPVEFWDANGLVSPNDGQYCALACGEASDCPTNQECTEVLDYLVCYPS